MTAAFSVRLLKTVLALACLLAAGSWTAARAGEDDPEPPYKAMRAYVRLQEKMAHGVAAARTAQPALMAKITTEFTQADPLVWRDPRNARAAILYLLSGGKPTVIRALLQQSTMPPDLDRLLKGALAYAEGQDQIARDLLDPIEPRNLPPALGGQMALVEATLVMATDAKKAAHLLDLARLLVPGSLVEEAALRRQITLQTDPAALDKFVALSRQYLHRFQTSIYAQNFKQHVAAMAVQVASEGDVARVARLDPVIAEFPPQEQRALYLGIAKAAMIQGRTAAARYAAERAVTIAKDTAGDSARAKLYLDAAAIVSDDVVKGLAALEAADRTRLSPEDRDLHDAALAVAQAVQAPVPDPAADGVAAPGGADASSAALLGQAQTALSQGKSLLEQAR